MPTFRSGGSPSLNAAVRRYAASRQLGGSGGEIAADQAAARTVRDLSLADKARTEAQAARDAEALRNNPDEHIAYGSDVANIDVPSGARLYDASRGVLEQPGPADQNDVLPTQQAEGVSAQPYPTAEPNISEGKKGLFRAALAAVGGMRLATGKTNAPQLAAAGGRIQDQQLVENATEQSDPTMMNRALVAAGRKPYLPNRATGTGLVLDQATGVADTSNPLALGNVALAAARARSANAVADRGGRRPASEVAPERVTRMIDMTALNEYNAERKAYDALPGPQRRAATPPSMETVRARVESRYRNRPAAAPNPAALHNDALDAIDNGADPTAVAKRYKEQTGLDLDLEEEE